MAILGHTLAPPESPQKISARSVQSISSNGRNRFRPIRPNPPLLISGPNRPTAKNLPRTSRPQNFLPQTVFQLLHHWQTLWTAPKKCWPVRPNWAGRPNCFSGGKPSQARMRQVPQVSSQSAQASRRRYESDRQTDGRGRTDAIFTFKRPISHMQEMKIF